MDWETRKNPKTEYPLIIGGKAVEATSWFEVLNPADESVVAQCPQGTPELADQAVASAREAFPAWAATADPARAEKLDAIADLVAEHRQELSELLTRERARTQSGPGAGLELDGTEGWLRATAALSLPQQVIQDDAQGRIVVDRKPVGVVVSITPWNWPLMIAVWHLAPAIRAGCTVVIKPSPFTPLSTLRLVELMNRVLPPGVVNSVTGEGEVGIA